MPFFTTKPPVRDRPGPEPPDRGSARRHPRRSRTAPRPGLPRGAHVAALIPTPAPNSGTKLRHQTPAPNSGTKLRHQTPAPNSGTKLRHQTPAPNSDTGTTASSTMAGALPVLIPKTHPKSTNDYSGVQPAPGAHRLPSRPRAADMSMGPLRGRGRRQRVQSPPRFLERDLSLRPLRARAHTWVVRRPESRNRLVSRPDPWIHRCRLPSGRGLGRARHRRGPKTRRPWTGCRQNRADLSRSRPPHDRRALRVGRRVPAGHLRPMGIQRDREDPSSPREPRSTR